MNDKEGRKWLLQKLYNRGFKYIFYAGTVGGYLATKKQPKTKKEGTYINGDFERIDVLSGILPDFNEPNYLDIGKYLGIVDWSKVAVDTPIVVKNGIGVELNRHFQKFDNGKIYYFSNGRTSWSGITSDETAPNNVRLAGLAGGDDEN